MPICNSCSKQFYLPSFTSDVSTYCSAQCLQLDRQALFSDDRVFDARYLFGGQNPPNIIKPLGSQEYTFLNMFGDSTVANLNQLQMSKVYQPFLPSPQQAGGLVQYPMTFCPSFSSRLPEQPTNIYIKFDLETEKVMASNIVNLNIDYTGQSVPVQTKRLTKYDTITVGDLHGNTLTLMIILIQCGVLKFKNRALAVQTYGILSDIIKRESPNTGRDDRSRFFDTLPENELDRYVIFITTLEQNFDIASDPPSIRLIGDILSDRMSADQLTLALIGFVHRAYAQLQSVQNISRLSECHFGIEPQITILLSNHDNEFINGLTEYPKHVDLPETVSEENLESLQVRSKIKFFNLIYSFISGDTKPTDLIQGLQKQEILARIKLDIQSYVNCLVLFDFELIRTHHGELMRALYSHASLHPRIALGLMKMLAYDIQIDGPDQYPFDSKRSLGDFTQKELLILIKRANLRLRALCRGIAENWCQSIDINKPSEQFNVRALHCRIYKRMFYCHDTIIHPQGPMQQSQERTIYPCYAYLAIWLRIVSPNSINTAEKPLHIMEEMQSVSFPLPFLQNENSQEKTRIVNLHGHDVVVRKGDISLDNTSGKGTWAPSELPIAISNCIRRSLQIYKHDAKRFFGLRGFFPFRGINIV